MLTVHSLLSPAPRGLSSYYNLVMNRRAFNSIAIKHITRVKNYFSAYITSDLVILSYCNKAHNKIIVWLF